MTLRNKTDGKDACVYIYIKTLKKIYILCLPPRLIIENWDKDQRSYTSDISTLNYWNSMQNIFYDSLFR